MSEILSIGAWRDNASLIADVARLPGFLDPDWTVLDATYGRGKFWTKHQPCYLLGNDAFAPGADLAHDYRHLPMPDRWCDVVVFDPDYKLNGTPALGDFDSRYGIDIPKTRDERLDDIVAGARECYRVCDRRLFVKCMDQVEGGRMRWQTDLVTTAITDLGGRKLARFDIPTAGMPQPTDKPCRDCGGDGLDHTDGWTEHTAEPCSRCDGTGRTSRTQRLPRAKHSTLLIFEKPKAARATADQGALL